MVGYPQHTANGISVQTLFYPQIANGTRIEVDSVLKPANGQWTVYNVGHEISAETPGGPWFTRVDCNAFGAEQGLPGS